MGLIDTVYGIFGKRAPAAARVAVGDACREGSVVIDAVTGNAFCPDQLELWRNSDGTVDLVTPDEVERRRRPPITVVDQAPPPEWEGARAERFRLVGPGDTPLGVAATTGRRAPMGERLAGLLGAAAGGALEARREGERRRMYWLRLVAAALLVAALAYIVYRRRMAK